jgi:hypothetical protein
MDKHKKDTAEAAKGNVTTESLGEQGKKNLIYSTETGKHMEGTTREQKLAQAKKYLEEQEAQLVQNDKNLTFNNPQQNTYFRYQRAKNQQDLANVKGLQRGVAQGKLPSEILKEQDDKKAGKFSPEERLPAPQLMGIVDAWKKAQTADQNMTPQMEIQDEIRNQCKRTADATEQIRDQQVRRADTPASKPDKPK